MLKQLGLQSDAFALPCNMAFSSAQDRLGLLPEMSTLFSVRLSVRLILQQFSFFFKMAKFGGGGGGATYTRANMVHNHNRTKMKRSILIIPIGILYDILWAYSNISSHIAPPQESTYTLHEATTYTYEQSLSQLYFIH